MAGFINMKMDGWQDLARQLEALGDNPPIKATMKRALLKRTAPIVVTARALVRKKSGGLARKIGASTQLSKRQRSQNPPTGRRDLTAEVFVGVAGSSQGHLIEFGTGPRVTKSGKSTGASPAFPFMRPAWEQNKNQVAAGFAEDLGEEIERTARRLSAKQARLLGAG